MLKVWEIAGENLTSVVAEFNTGQAIVHDIEFIHTLLSQCVQIAESLL